MNRCTALTRKRKRCPFEAFHQHEGVYLCHVHHPNLTYQKQLKAKHARKAKALHHSWLQRDEQGNW